MGELICPNCGSKVKLPEKSELTMGVTFSKESDGRHYLQMENNTTEYKNTTEYANKINELVKENKIMRTAAERLVAMKEAGMDTTRYFAMGEKLMRADENNNLVEVVDDVSVMNLEEKIEESGEIFNRYLDGRHVMAGMFRMLNYSVPSSYWWKTKKGFSDALNAKGYWYSWSMLADEHYSKKEGKVKHDGMLWRLAKMDKDGEDMTFRSGYYNKAMLVAMADDYIIKAEKAIKAKYTIKKCNGVPYYRLGKRYESLTGKANGDVFCRDLVKVLKKSMKPIYKAQNKPMALFKAVVQVRENMGFVAWNAVPCQEFKDSYKGYGSYWTARNMIRFHGCTVAGADMKKSLELLDNKAKSDLIDGATYRTFGWFKEFVNDNNFSWENALKNFR